MTGIKGKSGGFREGAQRPQKYGEPTQVMRIPVSLVPKIQKMLDTLEKKSAKKRK